MSRFFGYLLVSVGCASLCGCTSEKPSNANSPLAEQEIADAKLVASQKAADATQAAQALAIATIAKRVNVSPDKFEAFAKPRAGGWWVYVNLVSAESGGHWVVEIAPTGEVTKVTSAG